MIPASRGHILPMFPLTENLILPISISPRWQGLSSLRKSWRGCVTPSGFMRYELSQEIKLRVIPKLRFYWDDTPEKADRIESLIAEIQAEREARGEDEEESEHEDKEDENDEGFGSED